MTDERFVQDGWDTAKPGAVANENFDTILDLDSTNHVTMRRLYGDGQDDLIGRQTSTGTVSYYLTDHQGSVQDVVNSSGAVVGTLVYDGFGNSTTNTGSTDRYQYAAREFDAPLGLYFNRQRMYDPTTARFLGLDQSSFSAGDPNLYRYVGNSPTNGRDPSGLAWVDADSWRFSPLERFVEKLRERKNAPHVEIVTYQLSAFDGGRRVLWVAPNAKELFKDAIKDMFGLTDQEATTMTNVAMNGKSNGDNIVITKDGGLLFQFAAQESSKIGYYTDDDHAKIEATLRRHQKFVDARRDSRSTISLPLPASDHEAMARHASELGKRFSQAIDEKDLCKGLTVLGEQGGILETFAPPIGVESKSSPTTYRVAASRSGPRVRSNSPLEHLVVPKSSSLSSAEEYARVVKLNRPWSWSEDIPGGDKLNAAQRKAIRLEAIEKGLIPEVPLKPGTKFPDFEAAGIVRKTDTLPESLWKMGDKAQFDWLDARISGGRPLGTTWHHSEISGRMELVEFGPHNIINHKGGRSPGMWADAPR